MYFFINKIKNQLHILNDEDILHLHHTPSKRTIRKLPKPRIFETIVRYNHISINTLLQIVEITFRVQMYTLLLMHFFYILPIGTQ